MNKFLVTVGLLLMGLAVFVLGSPYYNVFITNKNQIFMLILTIVLLISAIVMKKTASLAAYWPAVYALFIAATATLFLNTGILNIHYDGPDAIIEIAVDKFSQFIHVVPVILVLSLIIKDDLKSLFITKGDLRQGLLFGGISFVGFSVLAFILQVGEFNPAQWKLSTILFLLVFVFANAVMEELWFRGIFLNKYSALIGRFSTILITSIAFGASHINARYEFPGGGIIYGLVVFGLGYAGADSMLKTKSLIGAVLFHAGYDLMIIAPIVNSLS